MFKSSRFGENKEFVMDIVKKGSDVGLSFQGYDSCEIIEEHCVVGTIHVFMWESGPRSVLDNKMKKFLQENIDDQPEAGYVIGLGGEIFQMVPRYC